ncbi:hypothetical protein TRM7557_03719 [Tritonibacter multivorans]|uniref:Uncharacterized protein n=1 Tax=Tritonibacter multivorans TaxID=928856 RepID=A0A0P1GJK7_9RHOB|nr:hypothetical protein [Tritonibacter multivorans]MDA7421633.1 hypothetical protein [Tritonibacter multivorans]CUH82039.1 hypothetical protein TRM7557_03719 [Tritonibacter multivorans]SFC93234.1 hypothetical protein SAMN04488049_10563 [Tritonibacter multivorans]
MTTFAITSLRDRLARLASRLHSGLVGSALAVAVLVSATESQAGNAEISQFVGHYEGDAEVKQLDGQTELRNMDVWIKETADGFFVEWHTAISRPDGKRKKKTYKINFQPSERPGVFAAAMTTNVFGHTVQMNPMKGEPFVWARVIGETLTVFSLYVAENGDYLMQQYDRTLAEGGLELKFSLHRNGLPSHSVITYLKRSR